jgi:hypothetical protein
LSIVYYINIREAEKSLLLTLLPIRFAALCLSASLLLFHVET